jgi:hypothetical protein
MSPNAKRGHCIGLRTLGSTGFAWFSLCLHPKSRGLCAPFIVCLRRQTPLGTGSFAPPIKGQFDRSRALRSRQNPVEQVPGNAGAGKRRHIITADVMVHVPRQHVGKEFYFSRQAIGKIPSMDRRSDSICPAAASRLFELPLPMPRAFHILPSEPPMP